jgi:predicted nucleic acid-binding protein
VRREPPLALLRRLAQTPPAEQATTTITLGELLYGAAKRSSGQLVAQVREVLTLATAILPFDAHSSLASRRRHYRRPVHRQLL